MARHHRPICQRSPRLIRSVRDSITTRIAQGRLPACRTRASRRSTPSFDSSALFCSPVTMHGTVPRPSSRSNCGPSAMSVSPGGKYTTTSPSRRTHLGHKACSYNDLCKIGKTQTIFRPRKPRRTSLKLQSQQQLPSSTAAASIAPRKVGAHRGEKELRGRSNPRSGWLRSLHSVPLKVAGAAWKNLTTHTSDLPCSLWFCSSSSLAAGLPRHTGAWLRKRSRMVGSPGRSAA
jgi:hypothetical protein